MLQTLEIRELLPVKKTKAHFFFFDEKRISLRLKSL